MTHLLFWLLLVSPSLPPEIFSPCKPSWICPNFKEVSWVTHQFTDIKKVSRSVLSQWLKLLISSIIYKPIPVPRYESPCIISSMSFLYSIYCTNERREFVCISEWSKKKSSYSSFSYKVCRLLNSNFLDVIAEPLHNWLNVFQHLFDKFELWRSWQYLPDVAQNKI